ncbi:AsiA anti-sigma70 protein [Aeromonas phage 65]|uniref:Anti-sigma factor n=2 Tax=Ishigurovirus osborne TaxID=260149 RepID=A0A219YC78_9CAUD|nr:anti-sigma factor [Aeromonas phage 65]ADQ53169.1 AsiA anti-sigma70 protein [Aeromonas phage 65]APU01547.1 anti-sigma factor [Aeromonas phage 65.2]
MSNKIEVLKDIVATASILIKFGRDDILDTQRGFIDFLSTAGFTTPSGKPLTIQNFRVMVKSLKPSQIKEIFEEFDAGRIYDMIDCMISQHPDLELES